MRQAAFAQFTRACIDERNLLEARMIITTYNQHVRLLSSEPFGWFAPPKFTRAWEPTLFMESLRSLTKVKPRNRVFSTPHRADMLPQRRRKSSHSLLWIKGFASR